MATLNKDIFVTVNNERIKLEGQELDQFLAQSALDQAAETERKAQAEVKAQAKAIAQAKLAALGLTVEDLQALGL